jgi:L-rhamnose mutarotase
MIQDEDNMKRVLLLDLKNDPDAIAAYRRWHRPGGPPAVVTQSIRDSGVESMEIWNVGDRLVMTMEVGEDFGEIREVRAWEELMDQFQQRLPFAPDGVKWLEAERIYSLDEQP